MRMTPSHGFGGRGLNMKRRIEIGFSYRQADDAAALGLQVTGTLGHADDRGFLDRGGTPRQAGGCIKTVHADDV